MYGSTEMYKTFSTSCPGPEQDTHENMNVSFVSQLGNTWPRKSFYKVYRLMVFIFTCVRKWGWTDSKGRITDRALGGILGQHDFLVLLHAFGFYSKSWKCWEKKNKLLSSLIKIKVATESLKHMAWKNETGPSAWRKGGKSLRSGIIEGMPNTPLHHNPTS